MKMRLLPLAVAALMAAPVPVLALDEAAIMQRLEQLEAQRRADQAEIDALRQQVQQLETASGAGVSSSEAQQLRAEMAKIDKRAGSRVASLKRSVDSEREKLRINGFMSSYAVKTTDSAVRLGSSVAGDDWNFRSDMIAGVQFSYQLDDRTDAMVQLVAEGNDDYDLEASWAFVRYAITPDTKVRMGRLAAPLYLYTDTIDVGFTYPWVRPPVEIYGVGANRYQGIDLSHDFSVLGWSANIQTWFGDIDSNAGMSLKYSVGTAATFFRGAWTLRGAMMVAEDVHSSQLPAGSVDSVEYFALAARYDDGAWLAILEGRHYETGDKLSNFLPSNEAFYGTLGYQFNRVMPYVTLAKEYTLDDGTAFAKTHQESVGVGLRYTLTDNVVLKGEATRYSAFDGTAGSMGLVTLPSSPLDAMNTLNRLDDDGATVMSVGFDAVF